MENTVFFILGLDFCGYISYNLITVKEWQDLNGKENNEMKAMQDMGMTDLQFKSWLKQIIRGLEGAKEESTKEETDKKLEELLKDLKEDLQG